MNVIFISQCTGRALLESRRILDQFAERRGERTWQTPITEAGLKTVRRLLSNTARRNTSVACHWLRGRNAPDLLWIVGNVRRFNYKGAVPTNWTTRDVLRQQDENGWNSLWAIRLLTGMAALLHDLGKSCDEFQNRLKKPVYEKNSYRHEWISIRILQAFIGSDTDEQWIKRLGNYSSVEWERALQKIHRDGVDEGFANVFCQLDTPIARAVGWLILSHHRLPTLPDVSDSGFVAAALQEVPENIEANWNEVGPSDKKSVESYWKFAKGLPVSNSEWNTRMARLADEAQKYGVGPLGKWASDTYVQQISRLILMLSDHSYSSRAATGKFVGKGSQSKLFANTKFINGEWALDQTLSEHLIGVMRMTHQSVRMLPILSGELPRLSRCRRLQKRSKNKKFLWQDKAGELAASLRYVSHDYGAFIVNMASTGCGKTMANAKIMYNFEEHTTGFRCCFALGLRTLSQQTGREYREFLSLDDTEVAIHTGGAANRELSEHYADKDESAKDLMSSDEHVLYEGNPDIFPPLKHLIATSSARSLLTAPMLVSTVDHLISASECIRGGRQILPVLRLMGSDLVLDELDDYDIDDLPALTRLVHLAGMLGSKVLISSATLPPSLVQGMFQAYRKGRQIFNRNRRVDESHNVCCMWVDEFKATHALCPGESDFIEQHGKFVAGRLAKLLQEPARRYARIVPVASADGSIPAQLAKTFISSASILHATHAGIDPHTQKRVSFGLIRMANIDPLYEVALELYQQEVPVNSRIHLCVYHSRFPLLLRSSIENSLDTTLKRKDPDAVFELPEIRRRLDMYPEPEQLFIVLASPVAEVGRDHDYDWAIVEPSSMRSIIQLAGRVRRHRDGSCEVPNIHLLEKNVKALKKEKPAFTRPGFEKAGEFSLASSSLSDLLKCEEYSPISAAPRIVERDSLSPNSSLVDLEHKRLNLLLIPPPEKKLTARQKKVMKTSRVSLGAYSCWELPQAMMTGILQRKQKFRKSSGKELDFVLLPDESGEDFNLVQLSDESGRNSFEVFQNAKLDRLDDAVIRGERIVPWGEVDYMEALCKIADEFGLGLEECARKFGIFSLRNSMQGWCFHPSLGFLSNK